MPIDSYADIRRAVLARMDEPTAADASDWYADVEEILIEVWRDLLSRYGWLSLVRDPPGVFITQDDITARTITISSTGTSITGTLDANPQSGVSMLGRKLRGSGLSWIARITAHTIDSVDLTLDAVPATVSAGTAVTIYQDEYTLASDVGLFPEGGMWSQEGDFIELWDEERLRREYPDPSTGGWPPVAFCRLGRRLIRLSHYPNVVRRVEYSYTYEPADPSGTGALAIPSYLRAVYLHGALALAHPLKNDRRAQIEAVRYERGIDKAIEYEERLRKGMRRLPHAAAARALYR